MFGVDTLIILGIVAAATIAAGQISANEQEDSANATLSAQQKQQMKQTQLGWLQQRGHDAMAGVAQRHQGHGGGASMGEPLQPLIQKDAIDNHYEIGRQAAARQADAIRTQSYIQAGSTVAQGIAGGALKGVGGGGGFTAGAGYEGTGADIGQRAGGYALNAGTSALLSDSAPVHTNTLQPTDPSGGFQLQASDYATLGGSQPYSASPFADDPYATASPYQNPNRYRFGL